ncbi:IS1 family transposase [Desulfococcaceae bacterium HSG8]|nr:IS1 family transposase [Desulfococcaceae bacterium HSG8]
MALLFSLPDSRFFLPDRSYIFQRLLMFCWHPFPSFPDMPHVFHEHDHKTGEVLAYAFGDHKDEVFLRLEELLEPFGIVKFYTEDMGGYELNLNPENHGVGKKNTDYSGFRGRLPYKALAPV